MTDDLRLSLDAAMTPTPEGAPSDADICMEGQPPDPGGGHIGPHPWTVTDETAASWALRKLGVAQREIKRADQIHAAEQARLDAWHDQATRDARSTVAFMESRLLRWFDDRLADDPKRRSILLPGGSLSARKSTRVGITDLPAAAAWLRDNGYADLITESVPVTGVKALLRKDDAGTLTPFNETGERIPGIEVQVKDNLTATPELPDDDG